VVAQLVAIGVFLLAAAAELLHLRRCRRLASLVFGPRRRPRNWARFAPLVRVTACSALAWGLVTLLLLTPKVHKATALAENEYRHILLVLDVSPSMRLEDAGPELKQSRLKRVSDLMDSFFKRVATEQYRLSVVAVYSSAKPVVIDTKDVDVVRNILDDLPMHYAFPTGETKLFEGLEEAARVARPWNPGSTIVLLLSDGDTVPATGMPKMPASVSDVLIVGVGDPRTGKFINGRQSRQDTSTLRQIATRLGGVFHDGNRRHLSSETLAMLTDTTRASLLERLTVREYALIAISLGAFLLAFLPPGLHIAGTGWSPGVKPVRYEGTSRADRATQGSRAS
jgi:Ca-activated chloride channel family protein